MNSPAGLEIVSPGAYASVQDIGRRGFRRIGVPWAGVLDPRLMRIANALVGNAGTTPVIECFDGGLQVLARGAAVRVAVAGDAVIEIEHEGERKPLPAWRSATLADGDILRIRRMGSGRIAVLALEGLALPQVMGSASTYARAALGGVDGRALAAGMCLPAQAASGSERILPRAPVADERPIRVVSGPQADHFSAATLATFLDSDYRVTAEADRMGVRLEGAELKHVGAAEIISDATVPGSIQVPGKGQPIVLLADGALAVARVRAELAGADALLPLPVSAEELLERLPIMAACPSASSSPASTPLPSPPAASPALPQAPFAGKP